MRIGGAGQSPWSVPEEEQFSEASLIDGSSPSARTAQLILAAISGGQLAVGERLPSERSLAEKLNVGRSAVREALSALEILGIVEVMPGSGTYVRASTSAVLPRTLSWGLLLDRGSLSELSEVRGALEVCAAVSVARRAVDLDFSTLRTTVDDQRHAIESGDTAGYVKADQAFHVELARLSENSLLRYLAATARALLRVWIERQVRDEEQMLTALHEHEELLDALVSGDESAADEAMRRHMSTAAKRMAATNVSEGYVSSPSADERS